jgi:hypothetical protein
MPRVGFEPTIPVFGRAKTFRSLDRAVIVTGRILTYGGKYSKSHFVANVMNKVACI